jgi:hypothetical protein
MQVRRQVGLHAGGGRLSDVPEEDHRVLHENKPMYSPPPESQAQFVPSLLGYFFYQVGLDYP